jgi:putative transferase (TIGR04331 family)
MIYGDASEERPPLEKIFILECDHTQEKTIIKENELRSELFGNDMQYELGGERSYDAYKIIMQALAEDLDRIHNRRLGRLLWEPMLSMWLYMYVCCAYITYNEVMHLMRLNDSVYTYIPKVRYINNVYETVGQDSFMFDQIRADIICAILDVDNDEEFRLRYNASFNANEKCYSNSKYRLFAKIASWMSLRQMDTGLFNPYIEGIGDGIWRVLSLGKVRNLIIDERLDCVSDKIDVKKRELIKRKFDDDFINIAYRCIGKNLPSVAMEGFEYVLRYYKKQHITIPKLLISSVNILTPIGAMLYSDVKKNGGKVYLIQHGGSYRYEKFVGYMDMPLSDRFYTAGNGGENTALWNAWKMKAMPFGKTLGYYSRYNSRSIFRRILFTCDTNPRYFARFFIRSVFQSDEYYTTEDSFIRKLSDETLKNVRIRFGPLPEDNHDGINRIEEIRKVREGVKFDDIMNFHESLARSDMLVACYLTTPVLEAINLGIPTLVIIQNRRICVEEGAEEVIEKLIEEKIIFTDACEAADYLNIIRNNTWEWWNEPKRKNAWQEFRRMYCSRSIFGRGKWVREILNETKAIRKK